MKKNHCIILAMGTLFMGVLLLAGCRQRNHKEPVAEPTETVTDTMEQDTMEAFYERMRRFDALHGGINRWEGDR